MKRFDGYYDPSELPIKAGDRVVIRKGVMVSCRGVRKPAGRTYTVTVHHVLCGMTDGDRKTPPSVRWSGTGGYWTEVDINDVIDSGVES